jgi:hypothetical protein
MRGLKRKKKENQSELGDVDTYKIKEYMWHTVDSHVVYLEEKCG